MKWTTEHPDEDGFYWFRGETRHDTFQAVVQVEDGTVIVGDDWMDFEDFEIRYSDPEWSDRPVPEPW